MKLTTVRTAIAAAMLAALSLTTVGTIATSSDAGSVKTLRSDHWPV